LKEVVIFNGSPRIDGNIATLSEAIADGAQAYGAWVKSYSLARMRFMTCQGCFYCRMYDDCAINDELHEALQVVKRAQGIVIGSPIYMMQMTGLVKNMYDRFFPLTDNQYKPRFGRKKMLTVYSQGMEDPHLFDSYFTYTASIFPSLGFDLMDNIVCAGAYDPERAEKNVELKIRAFEAGKAMALAIGCREAV